MIAPLHAPTALALVVPVSGLVHNLIALDAYSQLLARCPPTPLGVPCLSLPCHASRQVCRGELEQKSLPRHRVLGDPDDHRLRVVRGQVDRGPQLLCVSMASSVFVFCFDGALLHPPHDCMLPLRSRLDCLDNPTHSFVVD